MNLATRIVIVTALLLGSAPAFAAGSPFFGGRGQTFNSPVNGPIVVTVPPVVRPPAVRPPAMRPH